MEPLKQIANVAGYSGLYRIIKPGRAGVIVESLDDKKTKTMMGPTARVSVLSDISIYVDDSDNESMPLGNVLLAISEKYGDTLPVDSKASADELADFMASVVPSYDRDRVRTADIKKLVSWYGLLRQYAPELFGTASADAVEEAQPEAVASEETTEDQSTQESPVAETQDETKA
jgi:hypothetical protein